MASNRWERFLDLVTTIAMLTFSSPLSSPSSSSSPSHALYSFFMIPSSLSPLFFFLVPSSFSSFPLLFHLIRSLFSSSGYCSSHPLLVHIIRFLFISSSLPRFFILSLPLLHSTFPSSPPLLHPLLFFIPSSLSSPLHLFFLSSTISLRRGL